VTHLRKIMLEELERRNYASNRIASCGLPLLVNPLELSCLWRLHARHRTALCNSTSAAFSTPHSPMCRISLQLQPRSIYMLRHAHRPCVSSRPWPEQNHLHYHLRMSQDHAYPHSPWSQPNHTARNTSPATQNTPAVRSKIHRPPGERLPSSRCI
jgi:hypothetical protein